MVAVFLCIINNACGIIYIINKKDSHGEEIKKKKEE